MSYFRRSNPSSNWKRPKPKIYDCNARDIENFYQSSYGEYLNNKADIRSREVERDRRGDAESLTKRFEQRRASSLVYGEDDSPRHHRFIPNRQNSNDCASGSNEHSYLRSRLSSEDRTQEAKSSTSTSRNVTFNTSLNDPDNNSEMASIESRLEKLRKLREELGLPSEINGTNSASSSAASSSRVTTDSSSSSSTLRQHSPPEPRGLESNRFAKQGSAARSDSRSRTSPGRSGYDSSSYSMKSDRTSGRSGLDDANSSYSSRSRKTRGGDTNGLSASSYESSSSTTRNRSRVEKPSLDGIDLNFDDDALLTEMRKKIPSSSEILEKIRNMDID